MNREGETVGERIYLIREALGSRRDPMPLDKFAELIQTETGAVYDKSVLSRMETGDRKVTLEDVAALSQVDPLKRGRDWLGWGDQDEGGQGATDDPPVHFVSPQQLYTVPDPKPVAKRRRKNG